MHENGIDMNKPPAELVVGIRGGGEMASAVAWRLYMANIRKIFLLEMEFPLAVRRAVSFCEAVWEGVQTVEDVTAVRIEHPADIPAVWSEERIPLLVDPAGDAVRGLGPDVFVDAVLAKRNLGTRRRDARLVIGLGPGFSAGDDVHIVVETNRGHHLGRIIEQGTAAPNTGVPGSIGGYTGERVFRAPAAGRFTALRAIGDLVRENEVIGRVDETEVRSRIGGVIRGIVRSGIVVSRGLKLGDVDPRGNPAYCTTISDKARAIGGSVLEAVLRVFNAPEARRGEQTPAAVIDERPSENKTADDFEVAAVLAGDHTAVARAMSRLERGKTAAKALMRAISPHTGRALRIGVTGPPGAGKSTLISRLTDVFRERGKTVGIIAVDPTSSVSGGALFGDRLRMRKALADKSVFLRSMAAGVDGGGLPFTAVFAADILDAAGKDIVILETVGAGQMETDILVAGDILVVVVMPGAGDMVQAMKAGLMEIGDLYVVNKADLPGSRNMQADLAAALSLCPGGRRPPPVRLVAASTGSGMEELAADIDKLSAALGESENRMELQRKRRRRHIRRIVESTILKRFWTPETEAALDEVSRDSRLTSPLDAADRLLTPKKT